MKPSNLTWIGSYKNRDSNSYTLLLCTPDEIFMRDDFNKIEVYYWSKHLWNGLFSQLHLDQILSEPKLVKVESLPNVDVSVIIGFADDMKSTYSSSIIKGKIRGITLIEEGIKHLVVQSTMIFIAKNIISKHFEV